MPIVHPPKIHNLLNSPGTSFGGSTADGMISPHFILQWNCQSVSSKKCDLIYLANKYNPFIIAISETWLKPGKTFNLSGYSTIREDRPDGFAGSALMIKNSFPYSHISLPTHSDCFQALAVCCQNITFLSVYIPYPSLPILQELDFIFSSLPKPFVVLGDFNCHHHVWGSATTNSVGVKLLDMIDSHNLCLLNNGSPTLRTNPNENISCVDLTFCSPILSSQMSWYVLPNSYGSKHYPIIINMLNIIRSPTFARKPLLKHNLNNVDWSLYKNLLDSKVNFLPIPSFSNTSECSDAFSAAILSSADEVFPLKNTACGKPPSPPWWDKECSEAIKKRNSAEIIYSNNMSDENFSQLSLISNETKKLLHSKKIAGWKQFCSSITPQFPSHLVWQNIRKFRCSQNVSPSFVIPSQEWADSFMDSLAPSYVPSFDELPFPIYFQSDNYLDAPFSLDELKNVLNSVTDSSPGLDGITYSFLVHAGDRTLIYFLELFNAIMDSGVIPSSWKVQVIIPILKPNKDPEDLKSFRPIALSSVLAKVGEHLVKNRLEWFIENKGVLSESQFGFRRGRSTLDNLSIFSTDVRLSFCKNESVIGAFLDVSSAFDNVLIPILKQKLQVINSPRKISQFICNMLNDRFIHLKTDNESINAARSVFRGLPQGSVLSPLLFNIYVSDLENSVNNNCEILQFADDILLYIKNKDISIAAGSLNVSLSSINLWMENNGFQLSPSKSTIVIFSKKRNIPTVDISLNNISITVKNHVKFLGLILDSKLSGSLHCQYLVEKCERNLNIIRCLSGTWWGAHPYSLKLLYNAIIRSCLDYGSFIFTPGNKIAFRKLDLIQSKALRLVLGAMKCSPNKALQVECSDPPLDLRRSYLSDRYLFRCVRFSYHPLISKLFELQDFFRYDLNYNNIPSLVVSFIRFRSIKARTSHSRVLPIFSTPFDVLNYQPKILNLNIKKHDPFAGKYFQHIINEEWKDWHPVFSDASKLDPLGCVGVSSYDVKFKIYIQKKCPPETTVFTGECLGILTAIEYVKLLKLDKIIICSDSLSAIQAICCNPFKDRTQNPLIYNIKKILFEYRNIMEIALAWVPGHSGIPGNVRVDELAKDAVLSGDQDYFKNYCHDLLLVPKKILQKNWLIRWKSRSNVKNFYSKLQPVIPVKPWFFTFRSSKKVTSIICRMRFGFCSSPVFLHKIHARDSSLCECGIEEGNLEHIFFSCPIYSHSQFYFHLSKIVPLPTNITSLLCNLSYKVIDLISSFITHNNINL